MSIDGSTVVCPIQPSNGRAETKTPEMMGRLTLNRRNRNAGCGCLRAYTKILPLGIISSGIRDPPYGEMALARERSVVLVDHHATRRIQVHAIPVPVLARREEIALGLHRDGDDLAARQSVERDHRRQVFLELLLVVCKRRRGEQY